MRDIHNSVGSRSPTVREGQMRNYSRRKELRRRFFNPTSTVTNVALAHARASDTGTEPLAVASGYAARETSLLPQAVPYLMLRNYKPRTVSISLSPRPDKLMITS